MYATTRANTNTKSEVGHSSQLGTFVIRESCCRIELPSNGKESFTWPASEGPRDECYVVERKEQRWLGEVE